MRYIHPPSALYTTTIKNGICTTTYPTTTSHRIGDLYIIDRAASAYKSTTPPPPALPSPVFPGRTERKASSTVAVKPTPISVPIHSQNHAYGIDVLPTSTQQHCVRESMVPLMTTLCAMYAYRPKIPPDRSNWWSPPLGGGSRYFMTLHGGRACFRCDDNKLFRMLLAASGTSFEPCPPYAHHKDGAAERMIGVIAENQGPWRSAHKLPSNFGERPHPE